MMGERPKSEALFYYQFTYLPEENAYICPARRRLVYAGIERRSQAHVYRPSSRNCHGCRLKDDCTRGAYRKLSVSRQC